MSKRFSLREFQEDVSRRLLSAAQEDRVLSRLGIRVGQRHMLLQMTEVSEVLPVPTILGVPLTQEWYRGIANIRGNLYSVTDLARFTGQEPVQPSASARLLLIQPRLLENTALLVNQIVGLRGAEQLGSPLDEANNDAEASWLANQYCDEQGVIWQEIHLDALIRHQDFLQVNRTGLPA